MSAKLESNEAMMTVTRRGFIAGALALIAAPAVVRAERLMPVRRLFVPQPLLPCDGRILRRADYPELFKVLAPSFGASPSAATFFTPNFETLPFREAGFTIATGAAGSSWPAGFILPDFSRAVAVNRERI